MVALPSRFRVAGNAHDLDAGRRGLTSADNSYEPDTREDRAWLRGLSDGRMRRLTVVRQTVND
jgi:hypothetical protein